MPIASSPPQRRSAQSCARCAGERRRKSCRTAATTPSSTPPSPLRCQNPCPSPVRTASCPPNTKRPVVGFLGVVSHWFNIEAVLHMASELPMVDFVLAGQLVEWEEELRSLPNLRLLGEKPYEEAPALLKTFDVAILPFDAEAEISATLCPAAFYEILAAGKKVVASALPCLAAHAGKYVLLADDREAFVRHIKACLAGEDGLAPAEERAAFAAENDWQHRWADFQTLTHSALASVAIVLCTKDNLAYCKACIAGILSQTALPNYEIIVVDRGSTDGTRDLLKELEEEDLPSLRVLLADDEKNFAAGCNMGIREATSDYVVLLEDNTFVSRGWLTALLSQMHREKELGLCCPATNLGAGEAKVPVYYRNAAEMAQYAYLYTWQHLGQMREKGKSLSLFCAILRRKTFTDLGPLDEDYQGSRLCGYDLSMALRKEGLRLAVAEDAFVHRGLHPTHQKALSPPQEERFEADKKHYEEKWKTPWKPRAHRPGVTREMNLDSLFPPEALLPEEREKTEKPAQKEASSQ
ncbi:glycosyltransferase [Ruminococcaceae bacterium OttesenSCG-928-I18]|nr:glycosyltransferase [Ruminococcaceae bacterium OttesenSCG-928-I18]